MAKKNTVKTTGRKAKSVSGNTRRPKSSKGRTAASSKEQPAVLRKSERVTPLTHEQIAERAEAIWQASGCLPGQDERNWCEAEAQLKAELAVT